MNIRILFNKHKMDASFETRTEEIVVICVKSREGATADPCTIQTCTTFEEMSRSATNGMICVLHSPDSIVSYEASKKEYSFLCKAFVATHRYGEGDAPGVLDVENLEVLVSLRKQTALYRLRQWARRSLGRLFKKQTPMTPVFEVNAVGSSSRKCLKIFKADTEHILQHFRLLPCVQHLR